MKKPTILVFSAHSADFCSRSGGTLAKCRNNYRMRVIIVTYGERGESPGCWQTSESLEVQEIKEIRKSEVIEAAGILGIDDVRCLDYDDNPLIFDNERLLQIQQ